MNAFFVVNPHARGGALGRRWPSIARRAEALFGPLHVGFTRAGGDATRLAREAVAQGFEWVLSCGGDGTHNEVLNGLVDERGHARACLGIVPAGTGGDFRRSLGLAHHVDAALQQLVDAEERVIDIGCIDFVGHDGQPARRFFLNIAGCGMSGKVVELVNASTKRLGGKLTFFLASARAMLSYDFPRCALSCEQQACFDERHTLVAVSNGRFFGGGMQIAPAAKLDDGLFDVVIMRRRSRLSMLAGQHRLYSGRHLDGDGSDFVLHRAASVEVHSPGLSLDVDGEGLGSTPARFWVIPAALRVRGG
ncbi:MAG: diacylglycerol kinase family lipid kinase [Myxococcota bacterium]|jgi:YegS/Rv2252/BmrU family lipid kinase|nr:diacylglycerol kinase family lipid kinase [Myxococcota bacterium]